MGPREAFKVGFLLRCAEEGLSPGGVRERVKAAAAKRAWLDKVTGALGGGLGLMTGILGKAVPLTVGGLGAATGLLGGHTLAKLQDPGYDPEEINRQELLATYDALADELEERRRAQAEAGGV